MSNNVRDEHGGGGTACVSSRMRPVSAATPRSARERPARPALSREAVVEAGLKVLQAEGPDGVPIRCVATELDTGAASLYVYVANRDELLDLMLDRVVSKLPI